ncbi:MAG: tetratricopeptide repeat protein, partial [Planctomycetota bacterium]
RMRAIQQRRQSGDVVDPAEEREIFQRWERSLAAYERAIELDPANPTYYNDAGVVLHYNLRRDLDRALSLYERSIELAEARLDLGQLSDEERAQFQQYVGWAENNRRLLIELMKADETSDEGDGEADPAGGSR